MIQAANLIGGVRVPIPGDRVVSRNPARPAHVVWSGAPNAGHVDDAVSAARNALDAWSRWPREKRFAVLKKLAAIFTQRADAIAALLREEVGKPLWDAKAEASILAGKIDITLDAAPTAPLSRVTGFSTPLAATREGRCWFRPHGVMAVVGPFNFPAHLPNGHIVPALAMGNTIVLKPSDKAPAVGQLMGEIYQEALDSEGAPKGVINVVQGAADVASRLVNHDGIDGILFTGSWPVGRRILEANLDRPGRMIALEMGGSNAAVIMPDADLKQAAIECVRCAFIGAGQRCTCTRRVIVHQDVAERFIAAVCLAASNLIIGDPMSEHPVFMGPVISDASRRHALSTQAALAKAGGEVLVPCTETDPAGHNGHYLTPGVMRVDSFSAYEDGTPGADVEVFGPFLRVCVARDLDHAIELANASRFGLAASIFTKDQHAISEFLLGARAGCVNVNTGTAGASSKLPFGGLGISGNHRPAGAFSLDYSAYPVAGMIESGDAAQISPGMRFEDSWLR